MLTTAIPTVNILDVNTGIYLPIVNGNAVLLSYYEGTADVLLLWGTTGRAFAGTNTPITMTFFHIGSLVCCYIGGFAVTASASGPMTAAAGSIPSRFTPATEVKQIVIANQKS